MTPLLDTNVLVRFLTSDRSPKYRGLYIFFQGLERGEHRVELKLVVLFQTIFVLKSFYKVPKQDIADGPS
jgi:predicted nucleic-acid-binding protein